MARKKKVLKWTTKTSKKDFLASLTNIEKLEPQDYSTKGDYALGDYLSHPKFGRGFVFNILSSTKIEVYFEESEKILLQNWK